MPEVTKLFFKFPE